MQRNQTSDAARDAGQNLKDAFGNLADVCQTMLERDDADQRTEEYFFGECKANARMFTETGEEV